MDSVVPRQWVESPRWVEVPALTLADLDRLVVVVANDDDADRVAGGLLSEARRRGLVVVIVSAPGIERTPPDGALGDHADGLRERLSALEIDDRTMIVAPWRDDGDDAARVMGTMAAAVAAIAGARFVEYPITMWEWARPSDADIPWNRFARFGSPQRLEVFITVPAQDPLSEHFFQSLYDTGADPWGVESQWYETRKRALLLASLPSAVFDSALEIGCSIGVFTDELAGRCARVTAIDIVEQPVLAAQARHAGSPHVTIERRDATEGIPRGPFDLVVLSEVAYYWSARDLTAALRRIENALTVDGVVVACHRRDPIDGYPQSGNAVHEVLRADPAFRVIARHEEQDFLLDVLVPARDSGVRPDVDRAR